MTAPVYGLVMAGGFSRRMGRDKALLDYHGEPQSVWTAKLLESVCENVLISCRANQDPGTGNRWPRIHDREEDQGPIGGFLSAHAAHPDAAWLAVACDLPLLTSRTLKYLIAERDPRMLATVYRAQGDGLPEPLCALYEPEIMPVFKDFMGKGRFCPRKTLLLNEERVKLIDLPDADALDNVNTPEDLQRMRSL